MCTQCLIKTGCWIKLPSAPLHFILLLKIHVFLKFPYRQQGTGFVKEFFTGKDKVVYGGPLQQLSYGSSIKTDFSIRYWS